MHIDPASATPLYQQVAADLRRKIVSGEIPVGNQVPTHRELAVGYGVSLITINKALSGLVSEGVLHSRVGRGTFVAVRPLEAGAGNVLGFVLRDLSSPFFSLVARAAQQRAEALGYGMLFSAHANRLDREDEQIRRFRELGVRGLIIVSMSRTYHVSDAIRALEGADLPYVMVSFTEEPDVPYVGLRYERAGYLAVQHLLALGRRRIGYIGDRFGSANFELRATGYRRALGEAGLASDPSFVFEYPFEGEWNDYRSGYALGEHVARLAERPDAMFVFNDLGALGFQDGLLDHGVRVPEDIAVVGLDDIELAARARVPLTTVRQPTERIGALAVDALVARVRGERPPVRQLLDPELIVRRSCGAPPPGGGAVPGRPAAPPGALPAVARRAPGDVVGDRAVTCTTSFPLGEPTMMWAKGSGIIAALAIPFAVHAQAQTGRITGTVTVAPGGQPLAGANVLIVGTEIRAGAGPDGRFTLSNVPAGPQQVRVQRIGYAPSTQTVTVTAGQTVALTFALNAQAVTLSEVVSVGYGTQSRRDVAGAVATVTTEALEKAPIASIDQVLQGTAAGVQVTTASNEPGGALSIRIRGMSSITGSGEPLYVIDGFPIENDIEGSSPGSGGRARTTPPNPLATLNPSDIASISILKDASSTAIYGARGANGVVIITTKQGQGLKPQFSLDYYTGASQVARRYDLLDAAGYMDYANAFGQASSQAFTPFPDSVKTRLLASGINTDWQDEVFRTGAVKNFQLGVRGATQGTNVTRYNVSGGFFDQDGILIGSGLRRLSSRLNVNQTIGSRVELGGSFTASQARSKATPTSGQQNAGAGAVSGALQYVPILPVYRPDGTYSFINTDLNAYNALLDAPQTPNPVSLAREVQDSLSDSRLLGNLFGQARLLDDLTFRVSVGADYANRWRNTYYPRTTLRGSQANGDAIRGQSTTSGWVNENTLTYQRNFGDAHDLTVLGGYSRQKTDVDRTNMTNSNFANDVTGYFDIGAGTREGGPGVSSGRTSQTLESWLSRVNYTLLGRYLFTLTYRADGSSRFAENKKWGGFPSAAFGWRLSDESFMESFDSIDELKLRASYGLSGNPSIRPYNSLARLDNQGYSFGGTPTAGYYPASIANPDLTWETTRQTDVGLDLGLWNRVSLTTDYYVKRTSNLLLFINLPFETGFEQALANRGVVDNKGFELALDLRLFEPGRQNPNAFGWRANFNYSANRNRVVDLGGAARIDADLITTDYNLPGTFIEVGKPIGRFYGFRSMGVIPDSAAASKVYWRNFNNARFTPGSMLIEDIDGDSVITLNDRTDIGDPTPKFTLGLTNTFSWKGVELTGLLQGSYGGKVLNVNRIRTESSPRVNILSDRFREAWTPTNTNAKYPKIGENPNQVGTNNFTDNLLEDGSYLRLRTLTLSYGLPTSLLRRASFTSARLYVTGANLFTLTDYSGFDPDVSGQSVGATNRGIDIGAYPLSRTVTLGLSLNY